MINKFRRWWFFNVLMRQSLRKEQTAIKNKYDAYVEHSFQLGIQALAFGDWCGVTSLQVPNVDPLEMACHVALGMYPICECGDWMHQHKGFIGQCDVCSPHFETENCRKFRFSRYNLPVVGCEIPTAIAFNQAIYNMG